MTDQKTALHRQLSELVGTSRGDGSPSVAPDPVNQPMIRHWAYALDDMNPVYLDPEFAAGSRFGGVVSPPAMLQTWVIPPPELTGIAERGGMPSEVAADPLAVIEDAGFTGIVATNMELEIERYPRLGDVISATEVIDDISEEKQTALGPGHFVTWVTTYVDQSGELLGRQRIRVLRFRPGQRR